MWVCPSVSVWPGLNAKYPPRLLYHSPPHLGRRRKYEDRFLGWNKGRERSLTRDHHRENKFGLMKINGICHQSKSYYNSEKKKKIMKTPSPQPFLIPELMFWICAERRIDNIGMLLSLLSNTCTASRPLGENWGWGGQSGWVGEVFGVIVFVFPSHL